jgi:hypothetical protein
MEHLMLFYQSMINAIHSFETQLAWDGGKIKALRLKNEIQNWSILAHSSILSLKLQNSSLPFAPNMALGLPGEKLNDFVKNSPVTSAIPPACLSLAHFLLLSRACGISENYLAL